MFGRMPSEKDFVYTEDVSVLTRFFEIWTVKEATGKCSDKGIIEAKEIPFRKDSVLEKSSGYVTAMCREDCVKQIDTYTAKV